MSLMIDGWMPVLDQHLIVGTEMTHVTSLPHSEHLTDSGWKCPLCPATLIVS